MTHTQKIQFSLLVALLLATIASGIFFLGSLPQQARASAPIGLVGTVATSSSLAVGPLNSMYVIGTSTPASENRYQCSARVITTQGFPILLSFASLSSTTLSTTIGHLQAASTTVVYDGGLYGCGYWTARGMFASSTITITEIR